MKKAKALLPLMIVWALVSALIAGSASGEASLPVRVVEGPEDAEEWIRSFLGESPEALEQAWKMTDDMRLAVALSRGLGGLAQSLTPLGKAEEIGPAREGELNGYRAFFVPCRFSSVPVDLVLVMEQDSIAGLVTAAYSGDSQNAEESAEFESVPLSVPVPSLNGELPGTLTLPRGEGPFPSVVLVHGSGPNDRDETMMQLKPFRDLAEGLAGMGIAVYRYDKRSLVYGAEMAGDLQATLEDETVEDAAAAVQVLALQERIDPNRIYVLGHSLGGAAVPAIDRALRDGSRTAAGYILMAASPRQMDVLIREQYDFLYSLTPAITPAQQEEKDRLFIELDRLQSLDTLPDSVMIAGAYVPYWRWLREYDILEAASEITVPCLLLQGEEDYQVTMTDFSLWQEAFGGRENWRLISYPGLTHPFTPGWKSEGPEAYARPEKVSPEVTADIADFILR